jgi:hypothetical protein
MLDNIIGNEVRGRLDAMPPIPSRKRRSCLGSCFGSLLSFFVIGLILSSLILALFAPWGYFLGGNFHPIPVWRGWGKLQEPSGDYLVYVSMFPTTPGRVTGPAVTGIAYICTPRGEQFRLSLVGLFTTKNLGLDSNNQFMHIHMYYRPLFFGAFTTERRPRLDLYGNWRNPNLVMEDRGTLASAFLPNGSAYQGPEQNQPPAGPNLPITLTPGSLSEFRTACHSSS